MSATGIINEKLFSCHEAQQNAAAACVVCSGGTSTRYSNGAAISHRDSERVDLAVKRSSTLVDCLCCLIDRVVYQPSLTMTKRSANLEELNTKKRVDHNYQTITPCPSRVVLVYSCNPMDSSW